MCSVFGPAPRQGNTMRLSSVSSPLLVLLLALLGLVGRTSGWDSDDWEKLHFDVRDMLAVSTESPPTPQFHWKQRLLPKDDDSSDMSLPPNLLLPLKSILSGDATLETESSTPSDLEEKWNTLSLLGKKMTALTQEILKIGFLLLRDFLGIAAVDSPDMPASKCSGPGCVVEPTVAPTVEGEK
ncbi:uncharacterized protein LOC101862148 [Aplysia californica]|uniref:Uncharacterized protein LOC101862148 n=1 Tax=Aplysia californica TaxID=6500 RepID=A0ABM0K702_APLCA|nr:uncharacterized protein LOC101862148 [Aplysia californica]